jgi:hypothetical protein
MKFYCLKNGKITKDGGEKEKKGGLSGGEVWGAAEGEGLEVAAVWCQDSCRRNRKMGLGGHFTPCASM